MAGIGFALRRLAREDSLNAGLRSQAHAVAVTSGPWLLTVLALGLVEVFASEWLGEDRHRLFSTVVVYNFAFSLVLTGPVVMVVTRRLADMLFARDVTEATGMLLGSLAVVFALQSAVGIPFYLFVVDMEPTERVLALFGFLLVGAVWLVSAFLSALKSYGSISLSFALGMGGGAALALQLAPTYGTVGLLAGFTIGLAVLVFSLVARVLAEYPAPAIRPFAFLPEMRRYWALALVGLLFGLATWVDKWIMWFAPGNVVLAGAMPTHPAYDSAMFLACLTMAPGAAMFLVVVETRFFEGYLRYYRGIANHATAQEIARNHSQILRILANGFRQVAVLQAAVCYLAMLAAPGLIGMARGGLELVPTFRFGVLGALCHGLMLFVVAILSYFDLRRSMLAVGATFLVLNAGLTWAALWLGVGYAGYGYFLASLLTLALAYALAARQLTQLPYMTFVVSNHGLR
ncbi:exopolysaccharide Pel transporter PelG [Neoroseomonas rubea]|uniref:exopolysaccharide Pel transporter PelG n=1 Tax=Neoroseomonas rubea TaxID=2748666 RepID=UPI0018DFBE65|nr:exopolysaccharide Pel transporter PelG [Roseomonas rubea]